MGVRLERVKAALLRPGQTVGEPVTNEAGAMLCPAGAELTEQLIERLKRAKVETVMVAREDTEADEAERRRRLRELELRYEDAGSPRLLELKALAEDCLKNP